MRGAALYHDTSVLAHTDPYLDPGNASSPLSGGAQAVAYRVAVVSRLGRNMPHQKEEMVHRLFFGGDGTSTSCSQSSDALLFSPLPLLFGSSFLPSTTTSRIVKILITFSTLFSSSPRSLLPAPNLSLSACSLLSSVLAASLISFFLSYRPLSRRAAPVGVLRVPSLTRGAREPPILESEVVRSSQVAKQWS